MVAVDPEISAPAPSVLGLRVNATTPPATGSIGLLATTVTASGLAKPAPGAADCGVLPLTAWRVNPWLWKAPMSGVASSGSPRWSVVTPLAAAPAPRAGLPGRRAIVSVVPP